MRLAAVSVKYLPLPSLKIPMPNRSTDQLIKLIARLTAAEKRQFKLFAHRNSSKGDILFVQLFDHIDKYGEYDEDKIILRIPGIKKSQLSNLKSNLYKQILSSLRQVRKANDEYIALRENVDFARILRQKGLYHAALQLLDRSKSTAIEIGAHSEILTILEIEKSIESLYITGSMYPRAKELRDETRLLLKILQRNHELSNLSLGLYGLYLQYGYVKDARDYAYISDYFRDNLPEVQYETLDYQGKLFHCQANVWYYNMVQDFVNCYRHAQRWLELYNEHPEYKQRDLTLYLKALHNVLNALFMAERYDKFEVVYCSVRLMVVDYDGQMNRDQMSTLKLIEYLHGINQFFLTAEFDRGAVYVKEVEAALIQNDFDWDLNRILLFHYKIASIYFCQGDLSRAIDHLNVITNQLYPNFREDIQCFARILNLIAHFDLGNRDLVAHQVKSTYRFLSKMQHLHKALKEIFDFIRLTPKIQEKEIKREFLKLKNRLVELNAEPYERRPFLYLDIISWLESKIELVPVGKIIARKVALRER